MAFTRVNPGGWAVGAQLTSAQQNQLDIDHANALDKTAAGDSIAGIVNFTGAGLLRANLIGSIQSTFQFGIQSSLAGGISSNAVGGFTLAGGATDWITFSTARSRGYMIWPYLVGPLPTGWGFPAIDFLGPATAAPLVWAIPIPHQGATLSSVTVNLIVPGPHANVPANLPTIQVRREVVSNGSAATIADLSTTPVQQAPNPGSGAAWDNGGLAQSFTYTCNQNNVIDNVLGYKYYAVLTDENGANSVANNRYLSLFLNFTNIADTHFP